MLIIMMMMIIQYESKDFKKLFNRNDIIAMLYLNTDISFVINDTEAFKV